MYGLLGLFLFSWLMHAPRVPGFDGAGLYLSHTQDKGASGECVSCVFCFLLSKSYIVFVKTSHQISLCWILV